MATKAEIRKAAEDDLAYFALLVNPGRLYDEVHFKTFRFLMDNEHDKLVLLPRGHQKSHCMAVWCAWWITKNPDTTIMYASGTEDLAAEQLYAIKGILESDVYQKYWPEMIHPEEAKREEWNHLNIKVDHPTRKQRGVRDRTVAARSIAANTTGLHGDILVLDDIVVPSNAYTIEGRQKVRAGYSQFASILNPGGVTKVCGTRYHGDDIYAMMIEMEAELFDDTGDVVGTEQVFHVYEEVVECDGVFLWPRTKCAATGKWFGFDPKSLARIRAKYFAANERNQYYAQYYNDPNRGINDDDNFGFDYWSSSSLTERDGKWFYGGKELRVTAGGDFAYTTQDTSDYTAFAVVGIDAEGFVYILDLFQFRTSKYAAMADKLFELQRKWGFHKCKLETNAGASMIVEHIRSEIRREGIPLVIEGKQSRVDKDERYAAIMGTRYANSGVFHPKGGFINEYEQQVTMARPRHDDLRDAVCAAVEICKAPNKQRRTGVIKREGNVISARFGGRRA